MIKDTDNDSELFFWIKSGEEKPKARIQSIQQQKQKPPPQKAIFKKPETETDSSRAGLKPGWIRATIIVKEDKLKKIKALAYWERREIKQVFDDALDSYLAGKKTKPIPEKQDTIS
jgi:hypothetical protein